MQGKGSDPDRLLGSDPVSLKYLCSLPNWEDADAVASELFDEVPSREDETVVLVSIIRDDSGKQGFDDCAVGPCWALPSSPRSRRGQTT